MIPRLASVEPDKKVFFKNVFAKILQQSQAPTLSLRLHKAFMEHASEDNSEFTLYLFWPAGHGSLMLQVKLASCQHFYKNRFKYLSEEGYYHRLTIEEVQDKDNITILDLVFDMAGAIGELNTLRSTEMIGNDELSEVYHFFADFLQIGNIHLDEDANNLLNGQQPQFSRRKNR